jgi:hypothetical protein
VEFDEFREILRKFRRNIVNLEEIKGINDLRGI